MSDYESFENEGQEGVVDPQTEPVKETDNHDSNNTLDNSNEAEKNEKVADSQEEEESQGIEKNEDENGEVENEDEGIENSHQEEQSQSKEENAIYRKMRLRAEKEVQENLELERIEIEKERERLDILRQENEAIKVEKDVMDKVLTEENISNVELEQGVSRDLAIRLLKADAKVIIDDERNKVSQRYKTINSQKEKLKNDEFYGLIVKDVEKVIEDNPNVDFETAYSFIVGKNYKTLREKLEKKTQKNNIAKTQDRMRRKPITSDGASSRSGDVGLSPKCKEIANVFGNDPNKIAARIKMAKSRKK